MKKNSLWAQVLSQKYLSWRRQQASNGCFRTCSTVWSAMRKGESVFNKGTKWIAGSESWLSFWFDKWLDTGPIRGLISGPLNRGDDSLLLSDVVNKFGCNWNAISIPITRKLMLKIKAMPIPFSTSCPHHISWTSSSNGSFELKEAYRLVNSVDDSISQPLGSGEWIWKVQSIPKIRCFKWQCWHRSIPVRNVLAARGVPIPALCPVCKNDKRHHSHSQRLLYVTTDLECLVYSFGFKYVLQP